MLGIWPAQDLSKLSNCCLAVPHLPADLGLQQWQLHGGDAIEAVNRLYDLVQQHQRVQEEREAAQDELHKAKVGVQLQQLHSQHML